MRFKPRTQSLLASLALSAFCLTLAATAKAAPCDPVCATISEQGKAVAPANAPVQVKKMIAAGNRIHRKPYVYGGGHSSFNSSGYDCSGTVSYLLRAAGALDTPLDSSSLMNIGSSGSSRWVSVYSNPGHAFIVVAGLRFDTSYITDGDASGPGWSQSMRPTSGYAVRHIKIAEAPGSDNVGGVATKETGEEQSDLVNGPPRPGGIKPIANLLISNSGGFGTELHPLSGSKARTVKRAAAHHQVAFWIMWGIAGAESTWGRGGDNIFGLLDAAGDADTSDWEESSMQAAYTMSGLKKAYGSWGAAMRHYSGFNYGLNHVKELYRQQPTTI